MREEREGGGGRKGGDEMRSENEKKGAGRDGEDENVLNEMKMK